MEKLAGCTQGNQNVRKNHGISRNNASPVSSQSFARSKCVSQPSILYSIPRSIKIKNFTGMQQLCIDTGYHASYYLCW